MLNVRSVAIPLASCVLLADFIRQLKDELLRPVDVLTLIRDGCDHPIRIAEVPILTGALEPTTVFAVQVDEVDLILTALRAHKEARRAVEELTLQPVVSRFRSQ